MPEPDQPTTDTASPARPRRRLRILLVLAGVLVLAAAVPLLMDRQRRATPPERGETPASATTATTQAEDGADDDEGSTAVGETPHDAEPTEHEYTNALIDETSPYLLQHAHNPVDWMPWGEAAFARAQREGKPIFLSVGYSTCYWCHVMEHESFEDEEVAAVLNEHYVTIKVDREERPDVDEQYMLATQLVVGRGGWPNSVWLTPDGAPFMAGTYFPKERFIPALEHLAEAWKTRREEVERQAGRLADAIARIASGEDRLADADGAPPQRDVVAAAVDAYRGSYDETHGGFGGAPKFPPHGPLRILLHEHARSGEQELRAILTGTLDAMWLGGMHDHVGGGFHRYATDREWLLPHFEKMLYDNGQLLRIYAQAAAQTGLPRYRRAVADIAAWLEREMTSPRGAFYSALDSGEVEKEGESYVWHHKEIIEVLGEEDGRFFAELYQIEPLGNFAEEATGEMPGTNIPHLERPLAAIAEERGVDAEALRERLAAMRARLLAHRLTWPQPHRDDKVLTAWNALMIEGLAYAGRVLDEPAYVETAGRAAGFLLTHLVDADGRLLRSWRAGQAGDPGYLDDHAYLIAALLELHAATDGDGPWLREARRLADVLLADFEDETGGAFFFTADDADALLVRSKSLTGGGNVPSPNGVAAAALLRLARVTGEAPYREAAQRTLAALAPTMRQSPRSVDHAILALAQWHDEGPEAPPEDAQAGTDASTELGVITAALSTSRQTVRPGGELTLQLDLAIQDGWHLYGPNPQHDFLIPTTVALLDSAHAAAGTIVAPEPVEKPDPILEETVAVHEGRIRFRVPVSIAADAPLGVLELRLRLRSQACDASRCLQPRDDELAVTVTVDAGSEAGR